MSYIDKIKQLINQGNLDYITMSSAVGHNNTKKISAILEILKIDAQSVANSKEILEICEMLIESHSTAFAQINL